MVNFEELSSDKELNAASNLRFAIAKQTKEH